MKLRKLSYREILTLLIWMGGANTISCVIKGNFALAGCNIGFGLVLIYLREQLI